MFILSSFKQHLTTMEKLLYYPQLQCVTTGWRTIKWYTRQLPMGNGVQTQCLFIGRLEMGALCLFRWAQIQIVPEVPIIKRSHQSNHRRQELIFLRGLFSRCFMLHSTWDTGSNILVEDYSHMITHKTKKNMH